MYLNTQKKKKNLRSLGIPHPWSLGHLSVSSKSFSKKKKNKKINKYHFIEKSFIELELDS